MPRVHKKDDKKPAYKGKGSNKSNPKSNGNGKSSRKGKTIRQVHKRKINNMAKYMYFVI